MKTIGLTGGIGSGKTTVSQILGELGASIIDADVLGHQIYLPGSVGFERVVEAFGSEVVGPQGTIDRKKLGPIVFADPAALKRLNSIVHPLIFEAAKREIQDRRAGGFKLPIVLEAAILIEANWMPLVDEVWLVVSDADAVKSRLGSQRGMPAPDVESRMRAQMSNEERRRFADVVIENTGSIAALRTAIERQWTRCVAA